MLLLLLFLYDSISLIIVLITTLFRFIKLSLGTILFAMLSICLSNISFTIDAFCSGIFVNVPFSINNDHINPLLDFEPNWPCK